MTSIPVTTVDEAETVIHLAAIYFSNTLIGCSYDRARELILQAAGMLGERSED